MKRLFLMITLGGIGTWGLSSVLGGCTGEESESERPPTDAGSTEAGDAGGSGSSGSSGSSSDCDASGHFGDGGPSGPHKIKCGALECNLESGEYCCTFPGSAGKFCPDPPRCQDAGTCALSTERCDEAADCKPGEKCCLGGDKKYSDTACRKDCVDAAAFVAQLCTTNEECGDAGPCIEKKCHGGRYLVCAATATAACD